MKSIIYSARCAMGRNGAGRVGLAAFLLTVTAVALVSASNGVVLAQHSGSIAPPGRLLASQCFQCHGTDGRAVAGFESITGESADSMYEKLLEMSRRRPENIMDMQARAYTPVQLMLIADYLSTLSDSAGERSAGRGSSEDDAYFD